MLLLQNNSAIAWLVPAGATLFAALLGATLPQYINKMWKRRNLRKAFYQDIKNHENIIESWGSAVYDEDPPTDGAPIIAANPFNTLVYETNSSDIGILTHAEVRNIAQVYHNYSWFDKVLQRYYDKGELAPHTTLVMLRQLLVLQSITAITLNMLEQNMYGVESDNRTPQGVPSDETDKHLQSNFNLSKIEPIMIGQSYDFID
jgi:hypothetical protein